ncbi:hypothetical protein LCGC14_1867530 [marine sediment metagenome]|uniref:Uncharacterized protein n=1 Tax=marine sediment metagenome TaxID=412755 RepID=A0A0F9IK07_9ZZZZ
MARIHETLSFILSVTGGLFAYAGLRRNNKALRELGGGLLFSIGIGGLTLTWDKWSARTGHHLSVRAFFYPVPLDKAETGGLCTHSGQLIAGAILLSW